MSSEADRSLALTVIVAADSASVQDIERTLNSIRRAAPVAPPETIIVREAAGRESFGSGQQVTVAPSWMSATSDVLVFVRAGGMLTPDGLTAIADGLAEYPNADLLYVDDIDSIHSGGSRRARPIHRPGYSPERLRAQMYLGELVAVRRSVAVAEDPAGDQLSSPLQHGRALSLLARCRAVVHLPRVLYERSGHQSEVVDGDALRQLNRSFSLEGFPGRAVPSSRSPGTAVTADVPPVIRLEPHLASRPLVSIVIPTNGTVRQIGSAGSNRQVTLAYQAVDSVLRRSTYQNYEVIVVTTPGTDRAVPERLQSHRRVRVYHDGRPFNFSNACNRGAVEADGDVLVFLNDDTEVRTENWLERLVMYATRPDIGAVGARLLYEDGRIQHAGLWTRGGHPAHRYERFASDHHGYQGALSGPQNCLAVTGACLAVEAGKFDSVGGFSPIFPSSYNDVDLCLKLVERGWRTVADPHTVLLHYESASRDPRSSERELASLHDRWRSVLNADPFDNPHHRGPRSEEFPPPDIIESEQRIRAGQVDQRPRCSPYQSVAGR